MSFGFNSIWNSRCNIIFDQFQQQGFQKDLIQKAIVIYGNDYNKALDWLLQNQSSSTTVATINKQPSNTEDEQINKAIQLSLKSQKGDEDLELEQYVRQGDDPVGLVNLGMTCYFNSVMQTIFHIREIRDKVLMNNYDQDTNLQQSKYFCDLLVQLQLLMASMLKGRKIYADPQDFFGCLQRINGEMFKIGQQNDFYEFQNCMFDLLEKAFQKYQQPQISPSQCSGQQQQPIPEQNSVQSAELSRDQSFVIVDDNYFSQEQLALTSQIKKLVQTDNPITEFFYGIAEEQIINLNNKQIKRNDVPLGIINLEVKYGDLYTALEAAQELSIDDYEYEKGKKCPAKIQLKIKQPPKILNFYINRLTFDKKTFESKKLNTSFNFEKEIFLDRYMCQEYTIMDNENDKEKLKVINRRIQKLEQILENWHNYGEQNVKLENCFDVVKEFLKKQNKINDQFLDFDDFELELDQVAGHIGVIGSQEAHEQMIHNIEQYQIKLSKKKETLEEQLEKYKQERSAIYLSQKQQKYELFAIIIHEGKQSSGHYFCYIYEDKKKAWYKFNDKKVCIAEEKGIFEEAFGKIGSSRNACSLFYRQVKTAFKPENPVLLQAKIMQEVERQDKEFFKKIDLMKVKKGLEAINMKFEDQLLNIQIKNNNSQINMFEKQIDFISFLLSESIYIPFGKTLLLNQILSNCNKEEVRSQLKNPDNLEIGIQQFYTLMQHTHGIKILNQDDEVMIENLKNFHQSLQKILTNYMNILTNINNKKENFTQNLEVLALCIVELNKLDKKLLQQTNLGKQMQTYLEYLLDIHLLKGTFLIDLAINKNMFDELLQIEKMIVDCALAFNSNKEIFLKQIFYNLENTHLANGQLKEFTLANQTSFKNQYMRLQKNVPHESLAVYQELKKKSFQYNEEEYNQIQMTIKHFQNSFNAMIEKNKLWKDFVEQIRRNKTNITQNDRIDKEELLYFEN